METDSEAYGNSNDDGLSREQLDYWTEQFKKPDTYKPSLPEIAKVPDTPYSTDSSGQMLVHDKADLLIAYATFRGKFYFTCTWSLVLF